MKQIQFLFLFVFLAFLSCCDKDTLLTECERKCAISQDQGNGTDNAAKYFFDPKEKKCKFGRWTGSDSLKPFDSLEECQNCGCE
jgi:Kunitz/Bovine pancreatic trypsin inhibitor domain